MKNPMVRRILLFALPVLLLPLALYVAAAGQMKLFGLVFYALLTLWLEFIAVFVYRCVRHCQGRRNKP